MGDEEPESDPGEQSLIRKARKKMEDSRLVEQLIRWIAVAAVAAGSSMATRQVGDGEHNAVVQESRAKVLAMKEEVEMIRAGLLSRVDVEENEREAALNKLDHRLTRIETLLEVRMGVAPMPSAAAPPN